MWITVRHFDRIYLDGVIAPFDFHENGEGGICLFCLKPPLTDNTFGISDSSYGSFAYENIKMKDTTTKKTQQLIKYRFKIFVLSNKKGFDILKSLIVSLYRRTDNARARGKKTKGQTTIYKTLHRKQKIEQYESGSGCSGRVGSSCANSCTHLVTNPVISHE